MLHINRIFQHIWFCNGLVLWSWWNEFFEFSFQRVVFCLFISNGVIFLPFHFKGSLFLNFFAFSFCIDKLTDFFSSRRDGICTDFFFVQIGTSENIPMRTKTGRDSIIKMKVSRSPFQFNLVLCMNLFRNKQI